MLKIALAGNPNSGKTTLFNALTGAKQYVGNWPGVTVEKKEGRIKGHKEVHLVDLPGIYSLSPYTLEEVVSRNYLLDEKPNAIINILDGSNLERNLYLTTQLEELGIPMVVAVNMMDVVNKSGDKINCEKLSKVLGCPVIPISAMKGEGVAQLIEKVIAVANTAKPIEVQKRFSKEVEAALEEMEQQLPQGIEDVQKRWYAVKLFERDEKVTQQIKKTTKMEAVINETEMAMDDDSESIIINERYQFIANLIQKCYSKQNKSRISMSDKVDKIVTNRFLALPIFAVVMFIIYYISITSVGAIVTDFTNDTLFGSWIAEPVGAWLEGIGVSAWLVGLIVDGIIGGVGAVIGFVPQMLVLFILLALVEECGYMARVAFIMDRIFRRFGLSGKSFIPMLIGTGCGIPGVMASRTIENETDRRMTIMTTTFMPCGAKMPIVALVAGAIFGGAWWVAPSAYFVGIGAIVVSGLILKKTKMFAGKPAPFVMELPAYHIPTAGSVFRSMWERGSSFIRKAGTIILLSSVLIWFLSSFGMVDGSWHMVENMDESILARIGSAVAPIFAPLGFGAWQSTVATIMGLVAKEEVVGVFGVLYGVSGDALGMVEEGAFGNLAPIAQHFTTLSAYSFLVFNLLCAPCFAAIGAIRREMNNGKWTAFAIAYQCIFAYVMALIFFQIGSLITTGSFGVGTVVAFVLIAVILYLLFRPYKAAKESETEIDDLVLSKGTN